MLFEQGRDIPKRIDESVEFANLRDALARINEGKTPNAADSGNKCVENILETTKLLAELNKNRGVTSRAEFLESYKLINRGIETMQNEIENPGDMEPKLLEHLKKVSEKMIEAKEKIENDFIKGKKEEDGKKDDKEDKKDDDSSDKDDKDDDEKDSDSKKKDDDDKKDEDDSSGKDDKDSDSKKKDEDDDDGKKDDDSSEKEDDGKDSDSKKKDDDDKKDEDLDESAHENLGLIIEAIENGDGYGLRSLLKGFKGNLNVRCDDHGSTAMHYAYMANSPKMAAMLESAGANPGIKDTYGKIPQDYLVENTKKKLNEDVEVRMIPIPDDGSIEVTAGGWTKYDSETPILDKLGYPERLDRWHKAQSEGYRYGKEHGSLNPPDDDEDGPGKTGNPYRFPPNGFYNPNYDGELSKAWAAGYGAALDEMYEEMQKEQEREVNDGLHD